MRAFPEEERMKTKRTLIYREIRNITLRLSAAFWKYRLAGVNIVHVAVFYIL